MLENFFKFAQQIGSGSRSDVTRPLVWPTGLLLSALLYGSISGAPFWLLALLGGLVSISLLVFLGAYIFFAIKDPNLLRSERYNIEKLAIEKGIIGDSNIGIVIEGSNGKYSSSDTESLTIEKQQ